jgi:dihydroorotate dehydrogenase (NAD+) catalytic subunit
MSPDVESRSVADEGSPARVLELLPDELGPGGGRACSFYAVGPEGFLERAATAAESLGASPQEIHLCLETPSLCGVGLCGSCECGGRLLCKEGTFVSVAAIRAAQHAPGPDPNAPERAVEPAVEAGRRALEPTLQEAGR